MNVCLLFCYKLLLLPLFILISSKCAFTTLLNNELNMWVFLYIYKILFRCYFPIHRLHVMFLHKVKHPNWLGLGKKNAPQRDHTPERSKPCRRKWKLMSLFNRAELEHLINYGIETHCNRRDKPNVHETDQCFQTIFQSMLSISSAYSFDCSTFCFFSFV